jgi:hypothetical protein
MSCLRTGRGRETESLPFTDCQLALASPMPWNHPSVSDARPARRICWRPEKIAELRRMSRGRDWRRIG